MEKQDNSENNVFFNGRQELLNRSYLAKKLCRRRYMEELNRGDIIVSPGDEVSTCYYLKSGYVIMYEIHEGKRRIFNAYDDGELLFCSHVLMESPSFFFYEAKEHTVLYSIAIDKVRKLLQTDPHFNSAFMLQLSKDMLVSQDLLRKTVIHSAGWLVADFLLLAAGRKTFEKNGMTYLTNRITQKQMADMLYINRITCLKELHKIEDLGLINMQTGLIGIVDREGLIRYRDSLEHAEITQGEKDV